METKKFCRLRQDLINKELGAPVGETFYDSDRPIEYRWLDEIYFQLFHNWNWENAESIDFDFEIETLTIHDLRGTFELTNSKGEIVKDYLEDYEACVIWATENGYNNIFNHLIDPIQKAMQVLIEAGYFGITWTLPDIIHRAKSDGYFIDEKHAKCIAEKIEKRHDAEIGINWENISFHVQYYCEHNSIPEVEFIQHGDEEYPTREIDLGEGIVKIATKSLSELIINENGIPRDRECEGIDDTIFFYVEDDQINLPESEISELIKKSL